MGDMDRRTFLARGAIGAAAAAGLCGTAKPAEAARRPNVVLVITDDSRTVPRLQTSFLDAQGNEICGAYYTYVRRI